jgi:hypothetical protein
LTKKGYDVLEFAKKLSDNVSVELLTGVTPEELVHFKNVITKIQQNSGQLDHPSNC